MNTDPTTPQDHDLSVRLIRGDLFERFRDAFRLMTGCDLRLVRDEAHGHFKVAALPFVTELCVPVHLSGRSFAHLCAGPIRINDRKFSKFENVARAMLDDGCSASDLRDARRLFDKLPVMTPERVRAVETMLQLFGAHLGEHAEKIFLQTLDTDPTSVKRARSYILGHLGEPMALEEVAQQAGVSACHFCKVFKRATGMTFTEFVNKARVEQAKKLLLKPQARVTEVAYDVGFQSLSQFNRSFRRVTAESPTQYRAQRRVNNLVVA